MADKTATFQEIKRRIAAFNKERDWDQFHTPKNLSMAMAAEAAELMELFLWSDAKESKKVLEAKQTEVRQEVADIIIYLIAFCNATGIDISEAIVDKMKLNAKKYPIEKCKGKSLKYNEYDRKRKW
jgi:NTP pyrophosphatase (non-canonical NTP hydrolase)